MRVNVEHNLSEDRLSRELWVFRIETGYILLESLHHETRQSTRHKFKGPKWDSFDERSYNSALSRPTVIPISVLADARRQWAEAVREVPVFIGWMNSDCRYDP